MTKKIIKALALFCLIFSGFVGFAQKIIKNKSEASDKDVMLMNRIGPSTSELYIANADGTGEHKLFANSGFDYHASFSADGKWIVFTSERNGFGQADIYRVNQDGSGLERLTYSPALDDQASLSPDASQVAFVSTREKHTANIWILNLKTPKLHNLTAQTGITGDSTKPNGFFHPSWSPDGKWIAFSSDRNTEWIGHGNGSGWEHVQELRIYIVHPDGSGLRCISKAEVCSGAPKWSPDGKQIVFYEIPVEDTWAARRPNLAKKAISQIISVNIDTGKRTEHTSGAGLKLLPQFLTNEKIGYLTKAVPNAGLSYTSGTVIKGDIHSPSWSSDGNKVVYERVDFKSRPQDQLLYSWDSKCEYLYTDVFSNFSKDGKLFITEKALNSSIAIMDADGSNRKRIFNADSGAAFMLRIKQGSPLDQPWHMIYFYGTSNFFNNFKQEKLIAWVINIWLFFY